MRFMSGLGRLARTLLLVFAVGVLLLATILLTDLPIVLDRFVIEVDEPVPARAIVCLGGGLARHNLPVQDAWGRIYTAVQLQADGFAPIIIFSGGGTEQITEAEVYAETAQWLGCPSAAIVLDPRPGNTAEHPYSLLELPGLDIRRDTPLLVVTSLLHSKRAALTFRKAGYTDVHVVVDYEAGGAGVSRARSRRRSSIDSFEPTGRRYDDPFNRLKWGLDRLLTTLRELAAIGVYKYRGQA